MTLKGTHKSIMSTPKEISSDMSLGSVLGLFNMSLPSTTDNYTWLQSEKYRKLVKQSLPVATPQTYWTQICQVALGQGVKGRSELKGGLEQGCWSKVRLKPSWAEWGMCWLTEHRASSSKAISAGRQAGRTDLGQSGLLHLPLKINQLWDGGRKPSWTWTNLRPLSDTLCDLKWYWKLTGERGRDLAIPSMAPKASSPWRRGPIGRSEERDQDGGGVPHLRQSLETHKEPHQGLIQRRAYNGTQWGRPTFHEWKPVGHDSNLAGRRSF